ncbi:AlpA family transcriptional regulator [Colwellia sp. 1_MG-2023]|uniref:helix-turn-helix transcriptional regulator n=1 Tax=Colwellia sp. 1_MG-2023 TaxID=3062649 RepID=UPI0026E2CF3D|nr:AlpA family transcriptional regulator [Colwellia sp. 1_MG-2023]MDO6445455.1 AlpA family transcriptional regulator [Colwellia sp. 1_MG-2023]
MDKPFTPNLCELADSMGISLYQRFTPIEASLFLRCPLAEITKLQANHQIEFIQLTEKQTEFFGFQLLNHLLGNIQVTAPANNSSNHQSGTSPPADKIIRSKEVQELTGLSRTTIWRLEREGKFPARVPLTASNVGWRLTDVQEWIRKI